MEQAFGELIREFSLLKTQAEEKERRNANWARAENRNPDWKPTPLGPYVSSAEDAIEELHNAIKNALDSVEALEGKIFPFKRPRNGWTK